MRTSSDRSRPDCHDIIFQSRTAVCISHQTQRASATRPPQQQVSPTAGWSGQAAYFTQPPHLFRQTLRTGFRMAFPAAPAEREQHFFSRHWPTFACSFFQMRGECASADNTFLGRGRGGWKKLMLSHWWSKCCKGWTASQIKTNKALYVWRLFSSFRACSLSASCFPSKTWPLALENRQVCWSGATRLAATCLTAAERKHFTCVVDESMPDSDYSFSAGMRDKRNVLVNITCNWSQCEFNNHSSSSRDGGEAEGLSPQVEQFGCILTVATFVISSRSDYLQQDFLLHRGLSPWTGDWTHHPQPSSGGRRT